MLVSPFDTWGDAIHEWIETPCREVLENKSKPKLTFCCAHRHPFTPPKLSAYVDEAKTYAAEYTLQTLGIPTEGAEVPPAAPAFPGMGRSVQQRAPGILFFLLLPCGCQE